MKSKYSKKLFPFSPGIPWTIKNNKYIIPEIDAKIWNRVLGEKDFIIACYGGLLESFFSLSYCEALSRIDPYKSISWMGDPDLEILSKIQGIANVNTFDLGTDVLEQYPVPVFMDKENSAYFNVLNNYLITKSYTPNGRSIKNKDIILKQIYQNCMIDWDGFVPVLRSLNLSKYKTWKKKNNFYDNSKFIVVFPDHWKSMHEEDCLGWSDKQVRELAQMVSHLNISVVACGNSRVDAFYNAGHVIRAPLDIEIIIGLIVNSFGILSADIDFLMISMMLSKETFIMSRNTFDIYDLYENAEFIEAENVIFTDEHLSPRDVFQYLDGARIL